VLIVRVHREILRSVDPGHDVPDGAVLSRRVHGLLVLMSAAAIPLAVALPALAIPAVAFRSVRPSVFPRTVNCNSVLPGNAARLPYNMAMRREAITS
jgi:hypothetical protein